MSSFSIGNLTFDSNLIQGPLAGFSCAPFRQLFYQFTPPAYCVSEMISASDIIHKHKASSRYLVRGDNEKTLCYQISGNNPATLAIAAQILQDHGADLIDLNCGCPKTKIRKKHAGSALLENLDHLSEIITTIKQSITIPLTVKIRVDGNSGRNQNRQTALAIEQAGADALTVHGRHWSEDYDVPCNYQQIKLIKQQVSIPVIANGDIKDDESLRLAKERTDCDAFMIARGGTGKPWLYQELTQGKMDIPLSLKLDIFMQHIEELAVLENEFKALLQSRRLLKYYLGEKLSQQQITSLYECQTILQLQKDLKTLLF